MPWIGRAYDSAPVGAAWGCQMPELVEIWHGLGGGMFLTLDHSKERTHHLTKFQSLRKSVLPFPGCVGLWSKSFHALHLRLNLTSDRPRPLRSTIAAWPIWFCLFCSFLHLQYILACFSTLGKCWGQKNGCWFSANTEVRVIVSTLGTSASRRPKDKRSSLSLLSVSVSGWKQTFFTTCYSYWHRFFVQIMCDTVWSQHHGLVKAMLAEWNRLIRSAGLQLKSLGDG